MRPSILIAALVVAMPIGLGAGTALAQFTDQSVLFGRRHAYVYEGAWCGHQDEGGNSLEDCSFSSFAQCQRAMMGTNNSFCTQNPAFTGQPAPRRRKVRSY